MSDKQINPNLVLAAAKLAYPFEKWVFVGNGVAFDVSTTSENYDQWHFFRPLNNDSDAWALEQALKKLDWEFRYWGGIEEFVGANDDLPYITSRCPKLLLLYCLSAVTANSLYE